MILISPGWRKSWQPLGYEFWGVEGGGMVLDFVVMQKAGQEKG
jgi:hypothetical protein